MGAPSGEGIENREIEADECTLPPRKDAESSFLGVVFSGQSLQTEAQRSARTLAPGARESVPPREGPAGPGAGAGREAAAGQPLASRGRCGGRHEPAAPSPGTELRFGPPPWGGRRAQGSAPIVTCPRRAKTGHDTLGPTPSLPRQVSSAANHCRGASLARLSRSSRFKHGLLRTYYVLGTS